FRPDSSNKPNGKTYTVKAGDSLWAICQKQLGNGSLYKKVYELNKTMMDKANKGKKLSKYTIYKGQVLRLV
ncbi:TPA: LysM peptidoglycan-binding domain-containing protein, partial [Clostridioides difficile]|nr:LysM peptidoglycan-binding domain-containing protein [Clostridioides difficile]